MRHDAGSAHGRQGNGSFHPPSAAAASSVCIQFSPSHAPTAARGRTQHQQRPGRPCPSRAAAVASPAACPAAGTAKTQPDPDRPRREPPGQRVRRFERNSILALDGMQSGLYNMYSILVLTRNPCPSRNPSTSPQTTSLLNQTPSYNHSQIHISNLSRHTYNPAKHPLTHICSRNPNLSPPLTTMTTTTPPSTTHPPLPTPTPPMMTTIPSTNPSPTPSIPPIHATDGKTVGDITLFATAPTGAPTMTPTTTSRISPTMPGSWL